MEDTNLMLVPLGSELLDKVWELYRKNSNTLGFLPRGALEEFAHAGCVLAATHGAELLGYAAWRHSKGEVVLVHLCVSEQHRKTDCSELLVKELIEQSKDAIAIRLRCRKDYEAANRLWPKHGFVVAHEVEGRGSDAEPLFVWRRAGRHDAPLLQAIKEAANQRASRRVAIDANVFFDLMDRDAPHHEESSALLADWIDDLEVCVTAELRNEISRQSDKGRRQLAQNGVSRFEELSCFPDGIDDALREIGKVLPDPTTDSDHSDRRQLAHAWRGGANIFVTRDETLLDHAGSLQYVTGMPVLRPSDAISRLQGNFLGEDYAPVRLRGTKVERRRQVSDQDLLPFQDFVAGEPKTSWLSSIRTARSAPNRYLVELIGVRGEQPRIALAIDRSAQNALHIYFFRALSGSITGTLLRRVIADIIESAREYGHSNITIENPTNIYVKNALLELGFYDLPDGRLVRHTWSEVLHSETLEDAIRAKFSITTDMREAGAASLEDRFWPLKILGADIQTYIVPIQRLWAAALFESRLAAQELFDVPEQQALALENVYYSASNICIPEKSRILWYVSGDIGEIRAASVCLGTDVDAATNLSRRYHRLGAYRWQDVLDKANGNPHGILRAYRFARTELMIRPIPWKRLSDLMFQHTGTKNQLQGPTRVPESLFAEIYQEGMRVTL